MKDKSTSDLSKVYLKIRNAIKQKEEEVKKLKEELAIFESALLEKCEAEGSNSISTPEGTVIRRLLQNYWTSDWDHMYELVAEHGAYHLLEKRIHNGNMKEFLAENPDAIPRGLQQSSKYVISVRKPSSK